MSEAIESPKSKTEDESGRPIKYVLTVAFRDQTKGEWLRHEYVRLDKPLAYDQIVMEFEYLGRPQKPKPERTAYGRQTTNIRNSVRPFKF